MYHCVQNENAMRPREFDEEIVANAVMRAFWRNGYAATSMNDLVDVTGLSRSTIYSSFGGKKKLFELALHEYHKITAGNVAIFSQAVSVHDAVRTLLNAIVDDELKDSEGLGCLAANSSLELAGRDSELTALVAEHFARLEECLVRAFKHGQQVGELAPDVDCQALADYFIAVIQGIRVVSKGLPKGNKKKHLSNIVNVAVGSIRLAVDGLR